MKKLFTFAMLAIMIGTVAGCSKKSSSTTPSYSMKVTIGGTTSSFSTCQAVLAGSILQVTGSSGASTTTPPYFGITIYNFTGAATYTINGSATSPTVAASYWPEHYHDKCKSCDQLCGSYIFFFHIGFRHIQLYRYRWHNNEQRHFYC